MFRAVTVLGGFAILMLNACNNIKAKDKNWSQDCEKHSTFDGREEDQCKKINALSKSGGVELDPNNVNRVDEQNIGKGH